MKKISYWLILAMVLGTGLFLRFADLSADPPTGISHSAGFYFDGISIAHSARSYVKFGTLNPDEWSSYLYSPTFTLFQIPWFKIFGTQLSGVNSAAAFWSALSMLLLVLLMRPYGKFPALLAAIIFSSEYMLVHMGRIGIAENMVTAITIGALVCLHRGKTSRYWLAASGCLTMLAFITKPIAPYFPVAMGIGIVFMGCTSPRETESPVKSTSKNLLAFIIGIVLASIPWLLLYRIPNGDAIAAFGGEWTKRVVPGTLPEILDSLARTGFFKNISKVHNTWIFSMGALAAIGSMFLIRPRKLDPVGLVLALWLAGGMAFVSLLESQPVRYTYPILPAMYGTLIYGIYLLTQSPAIDLKSIPRKWIVDSLAVIALTLVMRYFVIYRISVEAITPDALPRIWARLLVGFVLAIGVWAVFRIAFHLLFKSRMPIPRIAGVLLGIFIVAHFAKQNTHALYNWWNLKTYTIVETSRELGERFPGMIIGGTSACAAVVENDGKAIRVTKPKWCNYEAPFERYGITHTFVTDYAGELKRFKRLYPQAMDTAKIIETYDVCGYRFWVYQTEAYEQPLTE